MHQRNNDWGHLISKDFVHWRRLPDAVLSGSWDGSLTILKNEHGSMEPIILFDCTSLKNCLPPGASTTVLEDTFGSGDPPIIGVARPSNISDPNLTVWRKDDTNPAVFSGAPSTYSGPSNIWRNGDKFQMEMILGGATGLFETKDWQLHNWSLVNASFYPIRGGGGGQFFPLQTETGAPSGRYTHMLQADFPGKRDGEARFVLGTFDAVSSTFLPGPTNVAIDVSGNLVFSLVNVIPGEVSGMPKRMVHMGWVPAAKSLSIPRRITYLPESHQLLSAPVRELLTLRGAVLASHAVHVSPGKPFEVLAPGSQAPSYDLTVDFALPVSGAEPFAARVALLAAGPDPATDETAFLLSIQASGADPSTRTRNFTVARCGCNGHDCCADSHQLIDPFTFTMPDVSQVVDLRALVDVNIVEVFVASGRYVYTTAVNSASGGIFVNAPMSTQSIQINATVYSMACGWTV